MLSPVFMGDERILGRLAHEKLEVFRKSKKDSELARLSTYGAQEKLRSKKYPFHREKVKAMLLVLKVMLLAAEVMLLHAEVALLQLEAQP